MKRLHGKNGPIVLYERKRHIDCHDEWRNDGKYVMEYTVQLIWNKGLHWLISTGDFSVCEKSLGECVIRALHLMEKDPPRYYRLEEYMIGKGLWKQL